MRSEDLVPNAEVIEQALAANKKDATFLKRLRETRADLDSLAAAQKGEGAAEGG
jgi:hypothetical protein